MAKNIVNAAAMKHILVHHETGLYFGQPANGGIWQWGDEILVGFHGAYYQNKAGDNALDRTRAGIGRMFARSTDCGETWTAESGAQLTEVFENEKPCPGGIRFTHPDFTLAVKGLGRVYAVSYDRGKTWEGSYPLPDGGKPMKSRTDYVVYGPDDCLFMLSSRPPEIQCKIKDRSFCARTTDGGKTLEYISDVTDDAPRSVMSSSIRTPEGKLITALRRRWDADYEKADRSEKPEEFKSKRQCNWIDTYQSDDEGKTWEHLSLVAFTDLSGSWNGNPPALVQMDDGRLVVAYGYRGKPWSIRAKVSEDEGASWSDEYILRDDATHWDLGYPRMVQRSDGQLVTIYYIGTPERPEPHIEATIWHPDKMNL